MTTYIYGVIPTNGIKNFAASGICGREPVYSIPYQELAAVVSDSCLPSLNSLTTEEVVRYLFAHQLVIEGVMKEHTIIPFKFGTAVADAEEVKRILHRGYHAFQDTLEDMANKVELDVVAIWNKDYISRDISQQDEIIKFKQAVGTKPGIEEKARLGHMVEAYLNKKKELVAPEINSALAEVAQELCPHETPDAAMVINTAFLTWKEKQEAFDQKLDEIDKKYEGRLNFRRVGPLPPYSFSTAVGKKAEFEQIERARKLLDLGTEATPAEVKQAYWHLSAKYHPDRHPGDAEIRKKFEEIAKAYQLISEYCQGERCSFQEKDVTDFVKVDIVRTGNRG